MRFLRFLFIRLQEFLAYLVRVSNISSNLLPGTTDPREVCLIETAIVDHGPAEYQLAQQTARSTAVELTRS